MRAAVAVRSSQLIALAALAGAVLGCAGERTPNVVLVVIDTLRADRVSSYGYPRPTTPRIDALAKRGIRFANAHSTSSWTLPSHASLFTGRFPVTHGATQEHTRVDDALPTLAERFAQHGYATIGISGNGVVNPGTGLARGFEEFVPTWGEEPAAPPPPERHPNVEALRRSLQRVRGKPFFAFVNFVEVHGPYTPPLAYRRRFLSPVAPASRVASAMKRKAPEYYLNRAAISADEFRVLSDLYDGEVAYADALVGGLIDALEAAGVLDDTVVVVTSDHGENLGEHGHFRHVFSLYNTTVRIPLIVRLPGDARAGEVRDEPVSLVDLFPTLLRVAGIDPGETPGARDILAAQLAPEPVFAEYYFPLQVLRMFANRSESERAALAPYLRRLRSVEQDGWRLIWSSDGAHELYEVDRDADERIDRSADPAAAAKLEELLGVVDRFVADGGGAPPLPDAAAALLGDGGAFHDLDDATRRNLQALGYLPEEAEEAEGVDETDASGAEAGSGRRPPGVP